jgi:hypothetical protein
VSDKTKAVILTVLKEMGSSVTCPPKSSPVLMLDWRIKRGDKWSERLTHRNRLLIS